MGKVFFAGRSRLLRTTRDSAGAPRLSQALGSRSTTALSGGSAVGLPISLVLDEPHV